MWNLAIWAVIAGALLASSRHAAATDGNPGRHALDDARAARAAGRLAEAEAMLVSLRRQEPSSAAPARLHCEVLQQLGRRAEAIDACERALHLATTPETMRLMVAALVGGAERPTPDQMLRAGSLADAAVTMAPDQPWGHLARCDVARRWTDANLITACLESLRPFTATSHEARSSVQALTRQSGAGPLLGWAAIALLAAAAVTRTWKRRIVRRATAVAVVGLALMAAAAPARAQALDRAPLPGASGMPIDDDDPEASVPPPQVRDARPLEFAYYLQELIERAARATQRKDHRKAARYYRALAKAAPERSVAFSRLCESLEAGGDVAGAIGACKEALAREGAVLNDHLRFVRLVLARPGPLAGKDREDVTAVIDHLEAQPDTRLAGHHLRCELALRLSDTAMLERGVAGLVALAPEDAKTISFQWALAIRRRDRAQAERLVARAQAAGLEPAGVARMQQATDALARGRSLRLVLPALFLVVAAGAAIIVRRRRRPVSG